MWRIELDVSVHSDEDMSADAIADMIEAIVDHLDDFTSDPAVSATGVGHDITLHIEAFLPEARSHLDAHSKGSPILQAALHAAEIGTEHFAEFTTTDPRVLLDA